MHVSHILHNNCSSHHLPSIHQYLSMYSHLSSINPALPPASVPSPALPPPQLRPLPSVFLSNVMTPWIFQDIMRQWWLSRDRFHSWTSYFIEKTRSELDPPAVISFLLSVRSSEDQSDKVCTRFWSLVHLCLIFLDTWLSYFRPGPSHGMNLEYDEWVILVRQVIFLAFVYVLVEMNLSREGKRRFCLSLSILSCPFFWISFMVRRKSSPTAPIHTLNIMCSTILIFQSPFSLKFSTTVHLGFICVVLSYSLDQPYLSILFCLFVPSYSLQKVKQLEDTDVTHLQHPVTCSLSSTKYVRSFINTHCSYYPCSCHYKDTSDNPLILFESWISDSHFLFLCLACVWTGTT